MGQLARQHITFLRRLGLYGRGEPMLFSPSYSEYAVFKAPLVHFYENCAFFSIPVAQDLENVQSSVIHV